MKDWREQFTTTTNECSCGATVYRKDWPFMDRIVFQHGDDDVHVWELGYTELVANEPWARRWKRWIATVHECENKRGHD